MVAIFTGIGLGVERGSGFVLGSRGQLGDSAFNRYGENVSVNAATGNLAIQRTDEILIGQGPDSVLSRAYNSLGVPSDDNGDGWQLNAQRRVTGLTGTVNTAGSTVTVIDWDGSDELYTYDTASSSYINMQGSGAYDHMTFSGTTWSRTDGDTRVVEAYDNSHGGRLMSVTDTDGNRVSYTYDSANGHLTDATVTDASGTAEHTHIAWFSGTDDISAITTTYQDGTVQSRVAYTYDTSETPHRLSTVTTSLLDGSAGSVVTTYTYDGASARVASIDQTGGAHLVIAYTLVGSDYRVASLAQTTESGTATTSFSYDVAHNATTIADPLGQVTTLTYDTAGQLVRMDRPPAQPGAAATFQAYTYNANGDVVTASDGSGNTDTNTYDSNGNLATSVDQAGNTVAYTYGTANQLLSATHYLIPAGANQAPVAANDSITAWSNTAYTFDPRVNDSDPDGDVVIISAVGAAAHGTAAINSGMTLTYTSNTGYSGSDSFTYTISDGQGHTATATVSVTVLNSGNQPPIANNHSVTLSGSSGTVTISPLSDASDPDGDTLTITALSLPAHGSAVIDTGGTTITYTRTSAGLDGFTYTISDGHGHTATAMINIRSGGIMGGGFTPTAGGGTVTPAGQPVTTRYVYDGENHLRFVITPLGNVTEYRYDTAGNRTSAIVYRDGTYTGTPSAESDLATWAAGSASGDKTTVERTDTTYNYRSDILTVTTYSAADSSGAGSTGSTTPYTRVTYTYNYTSSGYHVTRQTNGTTTNVESFYYDGLWRLHIATDIDGATATTTFADSTNTVTTTTTASHLKTTSIYSVTGELLSAADYDATTSTDVLLGTGVRAYDLDGQLRMVTDPAGNKTYFLYDALGRKDADVAADGAITEYVYDASDRVIATIGYTTKLTGTQLDTLVSGGHPSSVSLTDVRPSQVPATDQWSWNIYDAADRLIETIDGGGDARTFAYDGEGNLRTTSYFANKIGATALAAFRTTPPGASLLPAIDVVHDSAAHYFYDDDGRLVGTVDNRHLVQQFFYNGANEKVRAVSFGFGAANFASLNVTGTTAQFLTSLPASSNKYQTFNVYDDRGLLRYSLVSNSIASAAVALRPTEYVYDDDGNLVHTIQYWGTIAAMSTYTVALVANQLSATTGLPANALNRASWVVYDTAGRVAYSVDPTGAVVRYGYDSLGEVTKQTAYATVRTGLTVSSLSDMDSWATAHAADAGNRIGRTVYDLQGRVVYSVDPKSYVTEYRYDAAGRRVETIAYPAAVSADDSVTQTSLHGLLPDPVTTANVVRTFDVYDVDGRLAYSIDPRNFVTAYVYDSQDRVTKQIRYAVGIAPGAAPTWTSVTAALPALSGALQTAFSYDAAGRLASQTDGYGSSIASTTTYAYDGFGRITDKTVASTVTADASTTHTDYDLAGFAWTVTQAYGETEATTTQYTYKGFGQVTTQVDAFGTTDATTTSFGYFAATDIMTSKVVAFGTAEATTEFLSPYIVGQTQIQSEAYGTADVRQDYFTYDADGRVGSVTYASGSAAQQFDGVVYDAFGDVIVKVVAAATSDSAESTEIYDADGLLTSETSYLTTTGSVTTGYAYDAFGRVLTRTDGDGGVTTYTYDAAGNVTKEVDALGYETDFTYDAFNNLVKTVDPRGGATFYYYDARGRLSLQVDAERYGTQTTYNNRGEIATVKRFANPVAGTIAIVIGTPPDIVPSSDHDETTTFDRDRLGRVTKMTDAAGFYEQYTYNARGELLIVRNKLGGLTTNTYNKRGWLVSQTIDADTFRTSGPTAGSILTNYTYDMRGNRISMVEAVGLPEQRTTEYAYDMMNRLTQTTVTPSGAGSSGFPVVSASDFTAVTSPAPQVSKLAYDLRGNVIATEDALHNKTYCYYDALNRKIAEVSATGTLSAFTYDANGNMLSQRVYDAAISTPTAGGAPPSPPGGAGYRETLYTYDHNNRLLTTTVAGLLTGAYSGSAYVTATGSVAITNTYDAMGNLVHQVDGGHGNAWYYYDKLGRKIAQVDQANDFTYYTLDGDGNVASERRYATALSGTTVTESTLVSTLLSSVTSSDDDRITNFTYDRMGRRKTEDRLHVAVSSVDGSGALTTAFATARIAYTYNALGEVTSKVEATGDETDYGYDAYGRQVSVTGAGFVSYSGSTVHDVTTEAYDGLGNLTRSVENGSRQTTWTYGPGGRLTRTTDASGFTHDYQYDAAGRVLVDATRRYASDGTTLITEATLYTYDAAGRIVSQRQATQSGSAWATDGVRTDIAYNAYGEVVSKGMSSAAAATAGTQETFSYDTGGRVWRSTAGDGTVKLYLYDANGKQTLTISSSGTALSGSAGWATMTLGDAVGLLTGGGSYAIGAHDVTGMVVAITAYDARGQVAKTIEPRRQLAGAVGASFTPADITRAWTYNAFGEVASETDALTHATTYTYSTLGKVLTRTLPAVSFVQADNTVASASASPVEKTYYDASGRVVGTADANANYAATLSGLAPVAHTRILLNGTGYDGSDAKTVLEFPAGRGSGWAFGYDVYGDLVKQSVNGLVGAGEVDETFTYDAMDRVLTQAHPTTAAGALTDTYTYDGLGRVLTHSNSQLGSGVKETTDYDLAGRVARSVDMLGHVTTYTYAWSTDSADHLAGIGGWVKTTSMFDTVAQSLPSTAHPVPVPTRTAVEDDDYFGRRVANTDFGGNTGTYTYDLAGRLKTESHGNYDIAVTTTHYTASAQLTTYGYFNTGLLASSFFGVVQTIDGAPNDIGYTATYGYDANGNRTHEGYDLTITSFDSEAHDWNVPVDMKLEDATVSYDALNRMTRLDDNRVNGRRESIAGQIDYHADSAPLTVKWAYDLNGNIRNTNSQYEALDAYGTPASSATTQDLWYTYDAQNRYLTTMATRDATTHALSTADQGSVVTYNAAGDRASMTDATSAETYFYNADGTLAEAKTVPLAGGAGNDAVYTRDAMGRVTGYTEYNSAAGPSGGGTVVYSRVAGYDAGNQVTADTVSITRGGYTYDTVTAYLYTDAGGAWQGGGVTDALMTSNTKTAVGSSTHTAQPKSETATTYTWWDSALTQQTSFTADLAHPDTKTNYFHYDHNGHLDNVGISDGVARTAYFITNAAGQIISRDEDVAHDPYVSAPPAPHALRYFFNGLQVGEVSNDGNPAPDYAATVAQHVAAPPPTPGVFRAGGTTPVAYANFDKSYDPINGDNQAGAAQRYTVSDGDTLQSVALTTWGDASLWYLIADANGLSASSTLIAGQNLVIPNKVASLHNNSSTFKVYDPNQAIGDVSPTMPKPAHGTPCGVFGQVLQAIVAVVVSVVTQSPELGDIAGQLFGLAVGNQKSFNWNELGESAIAALLPSPGPGANFFVAALEAAAVNAVTQGIGLALGMQKKFDWTGVAASAAGAAVGKLAGNWVGDWTPSSNDSVNLALHTAISATARDLANAATRTLISGTDFGDNVIAALPDALGSTIGGGIKSGFGDNNPFSTGEHPLFEWDDLGGIFSDDDSGALGSLNPPPLSGFTLHMPLGDTLSSSPPSRTFGAGTSQGVTGGGHELTEKSIETVVVTAERIPDFDPVMLVLTLPNKPITRVDYSGPIHNIKTYTPNYGAPSPQRPLASTILHGALALASFAPGPAGSIAMTADGMMFAAEGDTTNATMSFAAAGAGLVLDSGVARAAMMAGKAGFDLVKGARAAELGIEGANRALSIDDRLLAIGRTPQTGSGSFVKSADEAYDAIRGSTTDVQSIADNTGFKVSNIQKVKDHAFNNEHLLDRYVDQGEPAIWARFDSDLGQAEAWQRLETGTHTEADIQLLRHETAEAWYMRNVNPSYNAAHNAAEVHFPAPGF